MREVLIVTHCDACREQITELDEGSNLVTFIVRGEHREMDLCDDCIGGSFLQEARPVGARKVKKTKPEKPFGCSCGKRFDSARGLAAHQTRAAHD